MKAEPTSDGIEVKYNPWHDPRDDRFTFAPGGPRDLDSSANSRPAPIHVASKRTGPPPGPGHNQRPFNDPLTLEQAFPGLRQAPGGAIIAVADNFLSFTGPATDAQVALVQNWTKQVATDVRKLDPTWRDDRLGPNTSLAGPISQLNDLRMQRAATYLQKGGEVRPLQVETVRFIQQRTDAAYAEAVALLKAGRLPRRLSDQEALWQLHRRTCPG